MEKNVTVTTQGISQNLDSANGSYDTTEYGLLDREQLRSLLGAVIHLSNPPDLDPRADFCPPCVNVAYGLTNLSFICQGGTFFEADNSVAVDLEQAVALAMGDSGAHEAAQQMAEEQKPKATPARKSNVPPTPEPLTAQINTDSSSPQVSYKVYATRSPYALRAFCLIMSVLSLGGGLMALVAGAGIGADAFLGMGVMGLLAAPVFFVIAVIIRSTSRFDYTIGFDWSTNTLWTLAKGKVYYVANANTIEDIQLIIAGIARNYNPRSPGVTYGRHVNKLNFAVTRTAGPMENISPVEWFLSGKEAQALLDSVRSLLQQQV